MGLRPQTFASPMDASAREPVDYTKAASRMAEQIMAETFHTRIPSLSDSRLEDYRRNYSSYESGAVELALAELQKRGHFISAAEIDAIRAGIDARDAANGTLDSARGPAISGRRQIVGRQIRKIALMLLALGLGSAIAIYFTIGPPQRNPLGFDPTDTKEYLREMEVYGGQANVFSAEIQDWFSGLWHGKTLAFTVAALTGSLAAALWFVANRLTQCEDCRDGDVGKPAGTS